MRPTMRFVAVKSAETQARASSIGLEPMAPMDDRFGRINVWSGSARNSSTPSEDILPNSEWWDRRCQQT